MADGVKTLLLANPKARRGKLGEVWPELEPRIREALGGGEIRTAFTTAEDFGGGIVREALRSGAKRIIVCGGDGTLSEALNGFFENGKNIAPDAAVGMVPAGRGDDFFKMLAGGKVDDPRALALEILKSGRPQPMDLGRFQLFDHAGEVFTERLFMNIASFGYPGLVVERVVEEAGVLGATWLGKSGWAYLYQSAGALLQYKPIEVEVKVDGTLLYSGPLFSGFILNGAYNAGGVKWSDEAKIDDGLFHLTVMEPRSLLDTVATAPLLKTGKYRGVRGAHVASGRKVEVRQISPLNARRHPLFEIDGDLPEAGHAPCAGGRLECLAGAVRLIR